MERSKIKVPGLAVVIERRRFGFGNGIIFEGALPLCDLRDQLIALLTSPLALPLKFLSALGCEPIRPIISGKELWPRPLVKAVTLQKELVKR